MDLSTPQLVITNPKPGDKVKGVIKLEALAVDNVGIVKVEFWIDGGALAATELLAPYSAQYDTNKLPKGDHRIFAVAVDAAGNKAQTAEISFSVDNSVILPPPPPPPPPVVSDTFWTVFPKADQTIYVSSSLGLDTNDGLSESKPVKTLAKGFALLQPGNSHLLLKCGDVWRECFPYWNKSGASIDKPLLISSYGVGERPVVSAVQVMDPGAKVPRSQNVLVTRSHVDFVAVVGLHITDLARVPGQPGFNSDIQSDAGIRWQSTGQFFLVEDCLVDYHRDGIVSESPSTTAPKLGLKDLRIRRCVIVNNWSINTQGYSQGIYVSDVNGYLLEENIFDANGYHDSVPGASRIIFDHGAYMQVECHGGLVRGNVFSRNSATGIQMRDGGVCDSNFFVLNPVQLTLGQVNGAHSPDPLGVDGEIKNNFFLSGSDISVANPRGVGLSLGSARNVSVHNNIWALNDSAHPTYHGRAIEYDVSNGVNIALSIKDNIMWKWGASTGVAINNGAFPAAVIANNVTTGNFPKPDQRITDYDPAFFENIRKLSKATGWNKKFQTSEILKFFRAGFNL